MYYLTKATFETINDQTGRTSKTHELYLVLADSISDAEEKVKDKFKDTMAESFSVTKVEESKILGIIE